MKTRALFIAGALLPLGIALMAVLAPRERAPAEQFALGKAMLEARINELRTKTSRAATQLAERVTAADAAGFDAARSILEQERVDGVAVLGADVWAGRTFEISVEIDLADTADGLTVQGILDHPAHRVLFTGKPAANGRIAIAFAIFDERFPIDRNLGEHIASRAGLHEVKLSYASGSVPVQPRTERAHETFVIEGLVHATLYASSASESGANSADTHEDRLTLAALLALIWLCAWYFRTHPTLSVVAFAAALPWLAARNEFVSAPVLSLAIGGSALAISFVLTRRGRAHWLGPVVIAGGLGLLVFASWIAEVGPDYALFDSTAPLPRFDAALLLGGIALAALAVVRLGAAALHVRRPRGRAERMVLAAFATAFLVMPMLHREHRRVDRELRAESTRRLLDPDAEADGRLDRAVAAATDPVNGAHFLIAQSLAEGREQTDHAFLLWSASGWDPREPCAVEIYDAGLSRVSSFDLDAPPADQLPAPPQSLESARLDRPGRGAGESIRYRIRDVLLNFGETPVGLARFIMPVRWDLIRSNLRPPIFAEPETALVRAEFDADGHAKFVSKGSPDELPAVPEPVLARAREEGYATVPITFRDAPARMLVVPGGAGFGAVVTARSLWSQLLFESAHLLAVLALGCAIYTALRWRQMHWAFRHTIALFLVIVSMVPVLMIGLNQAGVIQRRYEAQLAAGLRDELDLAETLLKGRTVNNELCIQLSTAHRIDVNVYEGSKLVATSRPGVWDTGLLSRRLAAPAYEQLVLRNKRQFIGREPFAGTGDLRSGYRRIDEKRILATPRLSDRAEVERRIAEEKARLSALYVLATALAVLVSLPISYLLMRPVRRLEGATREVAAGNLDVEVPRAAGRGELSQLMASFEQMTRDLRDAQDLQARAERAAAWREMAQQIAHDVKNPLTPIKLTIQNLLALQREAPDIFEEEFERGSGLILEQIDQLQRIAGNFSSFARMPTQQADPVDVAALLKETAELHGAAGAIDLDLDTGDLVVRADRDELSRVLHNLLNNARESEAKSIQLRGGRENGQVRIDVVDDGRGIDPAAMDRIFEPSFTTRTRGTGLGLPIVKRIVDDLEGTIAIDSKVGTGTRVTILLPVAH